ncbi:MAG: TraR/DksA C4-type zinc finger protein [Bacillota bacterium]|nr:molecular chaperone DnaK [Bacillota bacterium]MDD3297583.1 molecular chaperone DnaK [Bacillota bacterium]MDD3850977.1 molecular chaperone DnaK [Bacillota bacterium]MDD4707288.1 molecular chaperone DnaK [Bacillota bacterium]
MDAVQLEGFKRKLEQSKEEAERTLDKVENNGFTDAQPEYISELSVYDNHPADIGSETYEMEKNMALRKQELHRLNQIEQALERIERGEYGRCDLCGGEIDLERLNTQPEADICLNCSQHTRLPRERVMEGRPAEEETLNYPYNRERSTKDERTIFDGEDSWQAVARYNRREDDPSNQTGDDQGIWDEVPAGLVEDIDEISNRYYKKQLPDDYEE